MVKSKEAFMLKVENPYLSRIIYAKILFPPKVSGQGGGRAEAEKEQLF